MYYNSMNRYPVPDLVTAFYANPNPITYTVIPYLMGRFLVNDYGMGGAERYIDVPLKDPNPIDIVVPAGVRVMDRPNYIRQQLRDIVLDAIEVAQKKDINFLLEDVEENSPPIKIATEQPVSLQEGVGSRSYFQVVRINNQAVGGRFGRERVFIKAPPSLVYDRTEYFDPKGRNLLKLPSGEEASCGFQYIHQKFNEHKDFKKYAKDFKTIKKWCCSKPPQYDNWVKLYEREFNVQKLGLKIQEELNIEPFEDELFKLKTVDLGKDLWSKKQEYNSMEVLDIIRWCMWAKLNCYVIDYDGSYYLSYDHNLIVSSHTDKPQKARGSVVVKVVNNHAYFVEDSDIKRSVGKAYQRWRIEEFDKDNELLIQKKTEDKIGAPHKEEEETDENYSKRLEEWRQELEDKRKERLWLHPQYRQLNYIDWANEVREKGIVNNPTAEDWEEFKRGCIDWRQHPPLTPEQLTDDSGRVVYLPTSNLNGLVNWFAVEQDIHPNTMNGLSAHTIDRATYGKNIILSKKCYPYSKIPNVQDLETLRKDFEGLPTTKLPTPTQIGNEIFRKLYSQPYNHYSYFNSNTRRAFFDAEVKADNRVVKGSVDRDWVFSFDLSKAYTNALKGMDCEWSMFDSINQFQKYDGNFNPNRFYLVEQLKNEYPLRDINKGLVLYHGCFLRHLLGKGLVIIKYVINPVRTLKQDYFAPFVDWVKDYFEDEEKGGNGTITYKSVINNFIGSMKKQDKVVQYKIHKTESVDTLTRAFYNGGIVSTINKSGERYKDDKINYIISKPCEEFNIQSANPIRLQIIDKINELLLSIHSTYRTWLFINCRLFNYINSLPMRKIRKKVLDKKSIIPKKKNCWDLEPRMCLTRTDAIYYEVPIPDDCLDSDICERRGFQWIQRDREFHEAYRNESIPKRFNFLCNQVVRTCPVSIVRESLINRYKWSFKNYKPQQVVRLTPNRWITQLSIDKRWSKDIGAKLLINLALTNGGAWFEGRGGVGKTEILKSLDSVVKKNRMKYYLWKKPALKQLYKIDWFGMLEEWRQLNPCFIIKLAPTNKACNLIGGKTLNKGLGIPVMAIDEEELEGDGMNYFDSIISRLSGDGYSKPCYDSIVIDEISMINGRMWSLLLYIKKRIPRISFILCGDIKRQLPPVGEQDRNFYSAFAIKELVNFQKIKLLFNFRSGVQGDILWDDWSINWERFKVIPKYKQPTQTNISYTNKKRKEVINMIQDSITPLNPLVIDSADYIGEDKSYIEDVEKQTEKLSLIIGTPLIANKSDADKGISKNQLFTVVSYDDDNIKLNTYGSMDTFEFTKEDIFWGFFSAYCITIHKAQGETFKDRYTIWDWDKIPRNYFGRRLRYTAQSRSTDPENNIVYKS